jgi:hypothetical protein
MIAAVIATSSGSSGVSRTKVRSIFSLSIGKLLKCMSEECPVPKSSMESFTPSAFVEEVRALRGIVEDRGDVAQGGIGSLHRKGVSPNAISDL